MKKSLAAMQILGLGIPALCAAQVQLPTVNLGLTNFEDGFGVPGWFLQEFPVYYDADKIRDSGGAVVPGHNHVRTFSTTTHLVFVSDGGILGGSFGAEILLPWVDLDVESGNGSSARISGLGDLTAGVGLQWAPVKVGAGVFAGRFMLDAGMPTGRYSDSRAVNLGNNFFLLDPYYALTYEVQKFEVSARLHYLWNSVNHEPFVGLRADTVQPGQAAHVNYSASYELIPNLRVGFNGYWLQQLTADRIDKTRLRYSLERTVGVGGGVQYFFPGHNTWIHLNGYLETDVRNRAQGYTVTLRFSQGIPATKEPS